jgi:hypothetical protein
MRVRIHKQVSFDSYEKQLFKEVIDLLENLQETLGEVDYDVIENLISDIEEISHMEWDLDNDEGE